MYFLEDISNTVKCTAIIIAVFFLENMIFCSPRVATIFADYFFTSCLLFVLILLSFVVFATITMRSHGLLLPPGGVETGPLFCQKGMMRLQAEPETPPEPRRTLVRRDTTQS